MRIILITAGIAISTIFQQNPSQGAGYTYAVRQFSAFPEINQIEFYSHFYGFQSAIDRDFTDGQLAYDYSAHLIFDTNYSLYRLYSGGRWHSELGDGDHVLQHISTTGCGGAWSMPHNRPEFLQGQEEGKPNQWFSRNYLEPEVLVINGVYYMYTQVQVNAGDNIDEPPGAIALTQADRIQLHISYDGDNWRRWSQQRGVVINLDQPTKTSLHHHEVIYVPWDSDGRCFWMYVAANINGAFTGYHRIRSDDPRTFNWQLRESGINLAQLGNQIGYVKEAPGGPLFLRITFTGDSTGRDVPTLQFSRDGIRWHRPDGETVKLEGSHNNDRNKNCYFLGLSTIDGTGQIEHLGNNLYRLLYIATTSNTPVAPEIFYSEMGVGELIFKITPECNLKTDLNADCRVDLYDLAILLNHWLEETSLP